MPPLRELAPQPIELASRMTTFTPRFARVRAAERPVKPAPIMATSVRAGTSPAVPDGIAAVVSQ